MLRNSNITDEEKGSNSALRRNQNMLHFEEDFLLSYAQNERNSSEFNLSEMVRGVGFEPTNPYCARSSNRNSGVVGAVFSL